MELLKKIYRALRARLTAGARRKYFNSSDLEVPALIDFISRHQEDGEFFSLLDVGACGSHASYASALRARFPGAAYDGVDIKPDPETAKLINSYYADDVTVKHFPPYDVTISVSALGRYAPDEQLKVFRRLCELAKTCAFVSFPFGMQGSVSAESVNITAWQLAGFAEICGGTAKMSFYYNSSPKDRTQWKRISQAQASNVRPRPELGVRCIGVLEIVKPAIPLKGEFHGITNFLMNKTGLLKAKPEYTPGYPNYTMFNTGGVELEVGEFLYAFVKMIKPLRILETGTHVGVSSMYMAQALKENGGGGKIITLEIFEENIKKSESLWRETGVRDSVTVHKVRSLDFQTTEEFDMLFLDSEPDLRFDELVRYYPKLRPGGFIMIHDLNVSLGLSDNCINGVKSGPFGDFREKFGQLIKDHSLQTFAFRTPRGFIAFQKSADDFSHIQYLKQVAAERTSKIATSVH